MTPRILTGIRSQHHVYFIPNRTVACEQMLEDEGVLQHVKMGEYHLGLIPFDSDILSLEIDSIYKEVRTFLRYKANAIPI
jgi:hypothetical protein